MIYITKQQQGSKKKIKKYKKRIKNFHVPWFFWVSVFFVFLFYEKGESFKGISSVHS